LSLRWGLKTGAMPAHGQARSGREKFLSEQKFIPDQIPSAAQKKRVLKLGLFLCQGGENLNWPEIEIDKIILIVYNVKRSLYIANLKFQQTN